MSATALPQVQAGFVDRLKRSYVVAPLVSGIFDEVPNGAAFPYIAYDVATEMPDRTFGQGGHIVLVTLSIFTRDGSQVRGGKGSAGYKEGLTIANAVVEELTDLDDLPAIEGHDVVDVDVDSIDTNREPDGVTRRIDVTLTATLEDES